MKDTTKGIVLGILFGVGATLTAGVAVLTFVVTPKTAAAIADAKSAQEKADNQKFLGAMAASDQIAESSRLRMAATQQIVDAPAAGFTVLLEPAAAKNSSALQLFDAVRPGLGTMLAKLQAAQTRQIAVKWVVPGHVEPASNTPGFSYCWLDAGGEASNSATCPILSQQ